jgi:hypothetical protein
MPQQKCWVQVYQAQESQPEWEGVGKPVSTYTTNKSGIGLAPARATLRKT